MWTLFNMPFKLQASTFSSARSRLWLYYSYMFLTIKLCSNGLRGTALICLFVLYLFLLTTLIFYAIIFFRGMHFSMGLVVCFGILLAVGFRFFPSHFYSFMKGTPNFFWQLFLDVARRLSTNYESNIKVLYLLFSQGSDLIDISILCGYVHLQKLDLSVNKIGGMSLSF